MPYLEPLNTAETLSYLHSCVSTRHIEMVKPDCAIPIDWLVCDSPVHASFDIRLGDQHLKVICVRAVPSATYPALLNAFNNLSMPLRWTVRYMSLSPSDGQSVLAKVHRQLRTKLKSFMSLLKGAVFKQETHDDPDVVAKVEDVLAAQEELGQGEISYGYLTLTIIVMGRDAAQATERAKRVQEVIDANGFSSSIESVNSLDAWLGSLPGQVYADVRAPLMMSLNFCDLVPAHSVWCGPKWNDHLDGPVCVCGGPLMADSK